MMGWRQETFQGADRFTGARIVMTAGRSQTYELFDRSLGEHVWIKEVPRSDGANPDVVVHEYETVRRLASTWPHVLRVHELFVGTHEIAFSSERLEGAPLDVYLARFDFDHAHLRRMLSQLVLAIDAVHRSGVIHGDIKPAHVVETPERRLVLIGFELAVPTLDAASRRAGFAGTPAYMAPEVIRGEPMTEATDFYAVGTILFRALTGRLPFEASALDGLLTSKVQEPAPRPSDVGQGVPADLDRLCAALLDPDPARRPGARAILRSLRPSVVDGLP